MRELGAFLGFGSQRPELDIGRGPDNLWAIGGLKYFVIECKSGATAAPVINKGDCNQLTGSMNWFATEYDSTCSATPIMVHLKRRFERQASPLKEVKIIDGDRLAALKESIRAYAVALAAHGDFSDQKKISDQLRHFKLTGEDIAAEFSITFEKTK
jgi:hypothetical protein